MFPFEDEEDSDDDSLTD